MKRMSCVVTFFGLLAAASIASAAISEPVKTDAGSGIWRSRDEC